MSVALDPVYAAYVFFALRKVMICNFANVKGKRSIIFGLHEAK